MANKVNNRDFVVAWATSLTLDEVVKQTSMTKAAVQGRRKFLENKGVIFPKLNTSLMITPLDIAQLNSLIAKHNIRNRRI